MEKETEGANCCLNNNSIIPSIKESERFLAFLNNKLNLGLDFSSLVVTIEQAKPNIKGFFRSNESLQAYTNEQEKFNSITLNAIYLKSSPFETIAHELAHFINKLEDIKGCSSNQYHNKEFKRVAEKLGLICEKGIRGFAYTKETPFFISLVTEFCPSQDAFSIFQNEKEKTEKKGSRLLKFSCPCGCVVRCASKTGDTKDKPLKAVCSYCGGMFE